MYFAFLFETSSFYEGTKVIFLVWTDMSCGRISRSSRYAAITIIPSPPPLLTVAALSSPPRYTTTITYHIHSNPPPLGLLQLMNLREQPFHPQQQRRLISSLFALLGLVFVSFAVRGEGIYLLVLGRGKGGRGEILPFRGMSTTNSR